jgi:hypothetical protein
MKEHTPGEAAEVKRKGESIREAVPAESRWDGLSVPSGEKVLKLNGIRRIGAGYSAAGNSREYRGERNGTASVFGQNL